MISLSCGWEVIETPVGNHILPVNDLLNHSQVGCACEPRIDDCGQVIHNSFDDRELREALWRLM